MHASKSECYISVTTKMLTIFQFYLVNVHFLRILKTILSKVFSFKMNHSRDVYATLLRNSKDEVYIISYKIPLEDNILDILIT